MTMLRRDVLGIVAPQALVVDIADAALSWRGGLAVIEASQLGLAPGHWPEVLRVHDGDQYAPFERGAALPGAGEFAGYRYTSRSFGTRIDVLND